MNTQRIGLLGGIGPQATGYFYSSLITKLKNSGKINSNADFPNIIINSINAPELTGSKVTIQQLQPIIDGIKQLAMHKPDYILMVCNTIHLYRDLLIQESGYANILSLRAIVEKYLLNYTNHTICVLGTYSSVFCGLYNFESFEYINPSVEQLKQIGIIIENYNETGEVQSNLSIIIKIILDQKSKGVDKFLIACTELSELLNHDVNNQYISTLDIMIDEVYNRILIDLDTF
jgi:aspartate racemase